MKIVLLILLAWFVNVATTAVAQSNVSAHYANGQVWIVWGVQDAVLANCVPTITPVVLLSNGSPATITNCLPPTYAIYWSPLPVTNTITATLVGRLFQQEWAGIILRNNLQASFGSAPTGFRIPDGVGGYRMLATNQGLFVHTVRSNFAGHYAVRPFGVANVPPEWRAPLTNAVFSLSDPPTCHVQARGTNIGYPVEWWTMWADGDTNLAAARPDFPIMENDKRRGLPHNFSVTLPSAGSLPARDIPACIAFHSGDGQAKMWLPENNGFNSIGLAPTRQLLVAVEDRFFSMSNGRVDAESIANTGYIPGFDPFFNHQTGPVFGSPPEKLPTSNDVIVPFPLYRLNWTLDWLYAHKNVDSNRVALVGHSGGAKGGMLWSHASPERFAYVGLYNPALGQFPAGSVRQIGTPELNLPLLLTNRLGELARSSDIHEFSASFSPVRDLPFTRIFHGKREENWVLDDDEDLVADVGAIYRQSDSLALGAALFWDLRKHGMDTWTFLTLSNDIAFPNNCHANPTVNLSSSWGIEDLWVPTLNTQFRRDDATNQIRHRVDRSYPAFFNCAERGGHGDVGSVTYTNNSSVYEDGRPYDGLVTTTECLPPWTGDARGTWGGYFDWEPTVTDTPSNWSAVVFLVGANSAFNPVEICPDPARVVDIAVRRPQAFKPTTGQWLDWRMEDAATGTLLTNGLTIVGPDDLVTVTNLTIPRDPQRVRLALTLATPRQAHLVTLNADGSFAPERLEIFSGETVEWQFLKRSDTIIPVAVDAGGDLCTNYLPYLIEDSNEFTGPLPRAASGIFTLSPEELPYASAETTWGDPNIAGVFIRMRWDDVHLGTNQFRWDEMDHEIQQAVAHGKVYSLGFKAGVRGTPQWIFNPNRTDSPATPLDLGYRQQGRTAYYGSPADANFRKHYFDLLRATAAHLRERNAHYRALAYFKISGLNLFTHENRLPNETNQLATWAGTGAYRPTNLYSFYHEQEALLASEFPDKDMSYALIQDGFPAINDLGEYAGQPSPLLSPLPTGAEQTETVLTQGRTNYGQRFVVQHNGLQPDPGICPNPGLHPAVLDPSFHYVGSGCPNRWVLEQGAYGQVTGFQTVAGITNLLDLESTITNLWLNSDGIFLEIYEAVARSASSNSLPSSLSLGQWDRLLHARRRAGFPTIPDPFPLAHRHTFTRTMTNSSEPQLLHFINGSNCTTNYGTVAILPDLSIRELRRNPNGSVRLTVGVSFAGQVRVDYSEDLEHWRPLDTLTTPGHSFEVFSDSEMTGRARFYRAVSP